MAAPNIAKPIYTTFDSVKVRLANKVQFQQDREPVDGELPDQLLAQLICDAETQVEQDLRTRYAIPFQSIASGNFPTIPDHSQRALRQACDLKAVSLILSTDFGRGGHVSADAYVKSVDDQYDKLIDRLLGRDKEGANDKVDRFRRSPPLDGVKLFAGNKADDGFRGMIINTDQCRDSATFAEEQINDPSQEFLRNRGLGGI